METVYSSENKPKSKVIKTSVLIDENGRLFARLTDSGVLLNVDKLSADDRVEGVPGGIVLATPLATAVPEKLFDYSNRNLFLEAVGIYPTANQEVLVSSAVDGVITVMAVERECAEWLKSYKVPVYHLLQLNLLRAKGKQFRSGRVVLLNMSAGTSEGISRPNEKIDCKGVQMSVAAAIGAEVKLINRLGIYAEAGAGYFFDNNQPLSYRSENPFSVTLQAGLRLHLGNK